MRKALLIIFIIITAVCLFINASAYEKIEEDDSVNEIYGLTDDIVSMFNRIISDENNKPEYSNLNGEIPEITASELDFNNAYKIYSPKNDIFSNEKVDIGDIKAVINYVWQFPMTFGDMSCSVILQRENPLADSQNDLGEFIVSSGNKGSVKYYDGFFADAASKYDDVAFIVIPRLTTYAAVITEDDITKISFDALDYEEFFGDKYSYGDYIPMSEFLELYQSMPVITNGTGDEFYVGGADNAVLSTSDGCGSAFTGASAIIISFVSITGTAVIKKR